MKLPWQISKWGQMLWFHCSQRDFPHLNLGSSELNLQHLACCWRCILQACTEELVLLGCSSPSTNSGAINQPLDLAKKWAQSDFSDVSDFPQVRLRPCSSQPCYQGIWWSPLSMWRMCPQMFGGLSSGVCTPEKKFLKKVLLPCRPPPAFAIFVYWRDALVTMMPDTFPPFCTTFLTSQLAALHKSLLHTPPLCSHAFPWWKTGNEMSIRGPWKYCSAQSNSLGMRWDMCSASPLLTCLGSLSSLQQDDGHPQQPDTQRGDE